jgi:hypothetical protein
MTRKFLLPLRLCASAVIAALVTGCSLVPRNTLRIGTVTISSPKDVTLEDFALSTGPDGTVVVTFKRLTSTNSPAVIDKAAAGQVAINESIKRIAGEVAERAAAGAAKGVTP